MIINHNISALNTFNQLSKNERATASSLQKLSSGLRINSAADDAAGLAISQKMTAQVNGLNQAAANAQNGISMVQTAEGALNETQSILQRMRELAVQSANDTNTDADRAQIQKEIDQLAQEITEIANDTEFNTQKLLNGGITSSGIGESVFQVGANENQTLSISINAMDAKTLGVSRDVVTGTVGGNNIASATFGSTLGSGIVDGTILSFTYNAASPATSGSLTLGAAAALTTNLSSINADTKLTITIDGNDYDIDNTTLTAFDGTQDIDALLGAINGAIGDAGTATADGDGHIVITSASTGSSSTVSVAASGTNADDVKTAFGITGSETPVDGQDAGQPGVTISGGTNSQTVTVNATDNSLTVSSGTFQGLTVTLGTGKTVANLGSGDTVTISADIAKAATFAGGVKTADAYAAAGIDVSTRDAASAAITTIDAAINTVSTQRAQLGAYQNRLDHTINNLGVQSQNLTAASSQITDVDMAKEMMTYTKNNILNQAAQAMLAQANQLPQGILQLLK